MNKLPQMPIRAKYADEFTEGSPAAKSITALQEVVQELKDDSAKVYVAGHPFNELTTDEINEIITGKYTALFYGDEYAYIFMASIENSYLQFFTISTEETRIIGYWYESDGDDWSLTDRKIIELYAFTPKTSDDANKVLTINEYGSFTWKLPAAGTKLYVHEIKLVSHGQFDITVNISAIMTTNTPITTTSDNRLVALIAKNSLASNGIVFFKFATSHNASIYVASSHDKNFLYYIAPYYLVYYPMGPSGPIYYDEYSADTLNLTDGSVTKNRDINGRELQEVSDIVTPL